MTCKFVISFIRPPDFQYNTAAVFFHYLLAFIHPSVTLFCFILLKSGTNKDNYNAVKVENVDNGLMVILVLVSITKQALHV